MHYFYRKIAKIT